MRLYLKAKLTKRPNPPKLARFLLFRIANDLSPFMLFFRTCLTFGGVAAAIAVMHFADDNM